jgi:tetratricopeptide (TPR) repeat protein
MSGRANPNAHLRSLADSLVQESRALAGAARFSEALAPAEESVLVWRGLASTDLEAYRFDLAVALDNYSDPLSDAGRPDDGLAAAQECVGLLRSAPHEDSALFLIPLAEATATVGRRLAELGQLAAAVAELQAAIALQRELSESDPSRIPDLAFTLCTLADQQRALGHDAESRTAARKRYRSCGPGPLTTTPQTRAPWPGH